ncbi:hypothetical protein Pelo_10980 [Pelomyxa schiedti]|nr:hypothetical protein Pelo_10980 [Pelomyxa schiedti]
MTAFRNECHTFKYTGAMHAGGTTHPPSPTSATATPAPAPTLAAARQFAALLASSHPRCGARSPARAAGSAPALMRRLWRRWVLSPAATLALVVEPDNRPWDSWRVLVRVSRATLGVVGGPEADENGVRTWLAPRLWLESKYTMTGGSFTLVRRDYGTTAAEGSAVARWKMSRNTAVNAKWLVACQTFGTGCHYNLTIRDIRHGTKSDGKLEPPVAVTVEGTLKIGAVCCGLFFNQLVPDQVLVIMRGDNSSVEFTLLDVEKTYRSKCASLVSSTISNWLPYHHSCGSAFTCDVALILRKGNSGAIVFILRPAGNYQCDCVAFAVDSITGCVTLLGICSQLSQVSESVFCTGSDSEGSYKLWDCNNLTAPLDSTHREDIDECFDQVVGCPSGLLCGVQVTERKILLLTAMSGRIVLTLDMTFLRPTSTTFSITQCTVLD